MHRKLIFWQVERWWVCGCVWAGLGLGQRGRHAQWMRVVHVLAIAASPGCPGVVLGICPTPETQARHPSTDLQVISVLPNHFFPSFFRSSGVERVSAWNMGSMVLGPSMASGQNGPSGLTAPEPVEEGSCTGSDPALTPGSYAHTCRHLFDCKEI